MKIRKRDFLLFLTCLLTLAVLTGCQKQQATEVPAVSEEPKGIPALAYASEGVMALENDAETQAAMEEALKSHPGISLEYKNDAISTDGVNFEAYVGNSNLNTYDMYINIFADENFTDELYLSQLIRPGSAFDKITLNHPLDEGDHRVYVVFTMVDMTGEEPQITGQTSTTMDFHVIPE